MEKIKNFSSFVLSESNEQLFEATSQHQIVNDIKDTVN